MPRGPLGGPRPGATSTLSMKIQLNKPDREISQAEMGETVAVIEQVFSRAKEVSITEDVMDVADQLFEIIEVRITFRSSEIELVSLTDIEDRVKEELGASLVGTTIEAV